MELNLVPVIANLKFPTIVTIYLLVRIDWKLETLSVSINSLNTNISGLNTKMKKVTHLILMCSLFF